MKTRYTGPIIIRLISKEATENERIQLDQKLKTVKYTIV